MDNSWHVAFCPHCGNKTPQRLIDEADCSVYKHDEWGEEVDILETEIYSFAVCEVCKKPLLYVYIGIEIDTSDPSESEPEYLLLYPPSNELSFSVPPHVRKYYEKAIRVKKIDPDGFAVHIRRALEAVCLDLGIPENVLKERNGIQQGIEKVVSTLERKIPDHVVDAMHIVRQLGNVGGHVKKYELSPKDVDTIDEFFHAIVDYFYVTPNRLQKLAEQLEQVRMQLKENNA